MKWILAGIVLFVASGTPAGEWTKLPSLPDKEGFAGSFAGISNGVLIVAGGANFPDKKPWEGGKKVWYDKVFVLEKPNGEWKLAGKLPRPLGYGISVTHGNGVICIGGSDADRHYADGFRLEWKANKLIVTELPALPMPLANGCGTLVGDILFVSGGQSKPDAREALKSAWMIDLSARDPKWKTIDDCPGDGRILAVAASFDGAFWVMGGANLVAGKGAMIERRYLKDAYRYDPGKGWKRIADLPRAVVAAPSPAPTDATGIYIFGGDDGSQIGVAPTEHRGFAKDVLRYDLKSEKWVSSGKLAAPRVTAPCVEWNNIWVVPSGEVRPGVRTPEVWAWISGKKE